LLSFLPTPPCALDAARRHGFAPYCFIMRCQIHDFAATPDARLFFFAFATLMPDDYADMILIFLQVEH